MTPELAKLKTLVGKAMSDAIRKQKQAERLNNRELFFAEHNKATAFFQVKKMIDSISGEAV